MGKDDPLSFYGRMKRKLYDKVRPDLVMPESQRHFPAPGKEAEYDALNKPWQNGPFKHALLDEQTASVPASLLRRCPDVTYCGTAEIMAGIV